MSETATTFESEIWNRTIHPELGGLSAAAAHELLRLRIAEQDTARVQELSAKANTGKLSPAETEELDHYLTVGRALEFLKAKARLSLRDNSVAV